MLFSLDPLVWCWLHFKGHLHLGGCLHLLGRFCFWGCLLFFIFIFNKVYPLHVVRLKLEIWNHSGWVVILNPASFTELGQNLVDAKRLLFFQVRYQVQQAVEMLLTAWGLVRELLRLFLIQYYSWCEPPPPPPRAWPSRPGTSRSRWWWQRGSGGRQAWHCFLINIMV